MIPTPIHTFVKWWVNQLVLCLPVKLGKLFETDNHNARLVIHANETIVHGSGTVVKSSPLQNPAPGDSSSNQISKILGTSTVGIYLSEALVFHCEIELPDAAEENIQQVLEFEMDRYTPFSASQAYFDFKIIHRNRQEKRITVLIALIKRDLIDKLLANLKKMGVAATNLRINSERDDVNDMDFSRVNPDLLPNKTHSRSDHLLMGMAALLIAALIATPLIKKHQYINQFRDSLSGSRQEALAAMESRKALENFQARSAFLLKQRERNTPVTKVLEELSEKLPHDTYLDRLEIRQSRLSVGGESEASSRLLAILEGSSLFAETKFTSPVTRNPRTKRERFQLEAQLLPDPADKGGQHAHE